MSGTIAKKERLYLWDNIKAFLIFLVVLGHMILPFLTKSDFLKGAYVWLNTFHMPLFIFISGLFSKKTISADKLNYSKIVSYILIFFFMKLTIYISVYFARGYAYFRILTEDGVPWYIFVMAIHTVITYLVKKLNPKKIIVAAFILSIAAGYVKEIGHTMMLSRIIVFFPLFYIGYLTDAEKLLGILRRTWVRIVSAVFFASFTVVAFLKGYEVFQIIRNIYTGAADYSRVPEDFVVFGPLLRIMTYVLSAVVSLSLISIMPSKRIPLISYVGSNTLPVYALHRQILYFYQFSAVPAWLSVYSGKVAFLWLFIASAVLTLVLATKPFNYILYPCTNYKKWATPLLKWFKK